MPRVARPWLFLYDPFQRAGSLAMLSGIEVLFNFLWFGMIVIGAVITWVILRRRDPFDDGALPEEDE